MPSRRIILASVAYLALMTPASGSAKEICDKNLLGRSAGEVGDFGKAAPDVELRPPNRFHGDFRKELRKEAKVLRRQRRKSATPPAAQ